MLQRMSIDGSDSFLVKISVQKSDYFTKKEGLDVFSNADVDVPTALNGGEIEIKGLHQVLKLNIPAGISSHTTLTIPGEGLRCFGAAGNHFVSVGINGECFDKGVIEKLKKLREENNPNFDETEIKTEDLIHPVVKERILK